ncbi:TPA: baseplate J/gp47 family protein [Klebsiella pneumoniae]|nr:baseplate J/gp47 family protein [Klebsiella pneumoniae]HCB0080077.1 baseplate J/gp47 family protein [Klebsiella pneumoniae]HEB5772906.1 baseplate J/gp47 family protein [Klebsiella pneumoniae]HEB9059495.1 baseplate J/gp47 family protein [Klebsiella pneumoniae]HEB9065116.1 baseplate J/gp47 family protein [Klebsiella pneumoniae]
MSDLPVNNTIAGPAPRTTDELRQLVIDTAARLSPGITTDLPGSLIEDMVGTSVGALVVCDQARVDLINSCSPYSANIHLLTKLGAIYGVPRGEGSNTSVYVVFRGPPGFYVPRGFTVGDGSYTYTVQRETIIPEGGQSTPVYCLATTEGTWAVPAGTVNQIKTSVPAGYDVTCTNLTDGLPGAPEQDYTSYRAQVMQAGMFAVQGTPDELKAALGRVDGVRHNLVSFRRVTLSKWVVIVGGGDPYEVAKAIYTSVPDISMLTVDVTSNTGNIPHHQIVTINDYPDFYDIPFIIPESHAVTVFLTWNTLESNFIDPESIAALSRPGIVDYINNIYVGMPINTYQLQTLFQQSVAQVLRPEQISMIKINIAIDGVIAPPDDNTGLISGDDYKYFTTDLSHVMVQKYDGSN